VGSPAIDPAALVRPRALSVRERSAHAALIEALFATDAAGEQDAWGSGVARATTALLEADSGVLVLGAARLTHARADGEGYRASSCDWMGPLAAARVWTCEEPPRRGVAGLTVDIEPDRIHAELSCVWVQPRAPSLTRARAVFDLVAPAVVGALRMRALARGRSDGSAMSGVFVSMPDVPRAAPQRAPARASRAADTPRVDDDSLQARFGLTDREAEITQFLVQGRSNADIAERLGIRPATARHHTEHILSKLGVHSRAGVTAVVYGLVSAPVHRSLPAARRSKAG
jgi:DNA-binding CsgD family transcriptional regulator